MGAESNIEWTHHTWNPVRGCTKISPGCAHCYAAELSKVNPTALGVWGVDGRRAMSGPDADLWKMPARWNRAAEKAGEIRRVFVNSMWDPFETRDGVRPRPDYLPVLERMRATFAPLAWLRPIVLTKRADVMARWARAHGWPATWWAGVSVEDQERADQRIPHLLTVDAAVRLLSMEPLLGAVGLTSVAWPTADDPSHRVDVLRGGYWNAKGWRACGPAAQLGEPRGGFTNHSNMPGHGTGMISWVIVGGESGAQARPLRTSWIADIVSDCQGAGVPVFVKQLGSRWAADICAKHPKGGDPEEWASHLRVREVPNVG